MAAQGATGRADGAPFSERGGGCCLTIRRAEGKAAAVARPGRDDEGDDNLAPHLPEIEGELGRDEGEVEDVGGDEGEIGRDRGRSGEAG